MLGRGNQSAVQELIALENHPQLQRVNPGRPGFSRLRSCLAAGFLRSKVVTSDPQYQNRLDQVIRISTHPIRWNFFAIRLRNWKWQHHQDTRLFGAGNYELKHEQEPDICRVLRRPISHSLPAVLPDWRILIAGSQDIGCKRVQIRHKSGHQVQRQNHLIRLFGIGGPATSI